MILDPSCRYCHGKLTFYLNLYYDLLGREPLYLYDCDKCDSRQCFIPNGECTHYQFTITVDVTTKYSFCFNPLTQNFRLLRLPNEQLDNVDQIKNRKPIIELNYLPHHLTPSTVSKERVRLMVLFS